MFDIDNFKHYNDTYGHIKGDYLIKTISNILKQEVRSTDIVGRYGGEEFIIIFPNTNNIKALEISENIRKNIENHDFKGKASLPGGKVTISAGVVEWSGESTLQFIEKADELLYIAKENGRNQVVLYDYY